MDDAGRILIVDDEETVLRTTAVLLSEEGYVCDRAHDASEALNLLARYDYDLLVTDWMMPGNTELEFVRAVQLTGRGIPVVVVTGYPQLREAIKAKDTILFAEVLKPFDFDDFLKVVHSGVEYGKSHKTQAPFVT
ncbi:MAG TPA: response regulator [bacterium]|jgi:DNA-binding NtrC family response regulator